MPDHYYSQKPQSEFKTETKQITIKNRTYTFTTSSGVFSKHGIDFGTKLLIEQFTPPLRVGYVEDAFEGRTTFGEGCVLAHRGWTGENKDFFSILLLP